MYRTVIFINSVGIKIHEHIVQKRTTGGFYQPNIRDRGVYVWLWRINRREK